MIFKISFKEKEEIFLTRRKTHKLNTDVCEQYEKIVIDDFFEHLGLFCFNALTLVCDTSRYFYLKNINMIKK